MSKNYQIKYSAILDDLTPAGVRSIIANMKKIADAQKKIDKDLILNKRSIYEKIALSKQGERLKEASKKQNDLERARYSQLLGRQTLMDKVHRLRKLKGDEEGLKKYIRTYTGEMTKLQNKFAGLDSWKKKSDNLAQQLVIQGRLNRAEFMLGSAIDANRRKRERDIRARERDIRAQQRAAQIAREARRTQMITTGATAGGALYIGKNIGAQALHQGMSLEQGSMAMRGFMGEKMGTKVFGELLKYATETAYSPEATQKLALGLFATGKRGKLKFSENEDQRTQELIALTKAIGSPILAYGTSKEGREEIATQLGQIMSKGETSIRQDLQVMQNYGMWGLEGALEKVMGVKSIRNLPEGVKVSSDMMLKAFLLMSKGEDVMKLTEMRTKSLSQGVDGLGEQTRITEGSLVLLLAGVSGAPEKLNKFSLFLSDIQKKLQGTNDKFDTSKNSALTWEQQLTVATISIGGMTLGIIALAGAFALLSKVVGVGFMGYALVGASALYLLFADWKGLIDDINQYGFKDGLLKHMDMLIAGAVTLVGILAAIMTLNLPALIAITGAAAGLMLYHHFTGDKVQDNQRITQWNSLTGQIKPQNNSTDAFFAAAGLNQSTPNMTPIPIQQAPVLNLDMLVNVDKSGNVSTKGKVRDPYSNPVWGGAWAR